MTQITRPGERMNGELERLREIARTHGLCPMWKAITDEKQAQIGDLTTRLVQQRRRLRELEELQATASSWHRQYLIDTLAAWYRQDASAAAAFCDTNLDRSGRLLGEVRELVSK